MPTLHWLTKETDLRKGKQIPFRILEKNEELSVISTSLANANDRTLSNAIANKAKQTQEEKRLIGEAWAKRSEGKCLFLFVSKKISRDLYSQILNELKR